MAANPGGIAALFFASGAVITVDELRSGTIAPSRYYGLVAGFFLIAIIASFQGDFALALAWLFFIAILVQKGAGVFTQVAKTAAKGGKA